MIRVLLVDDQKMVREALKISLDPETDIEVVGTASDGISAIEQVRNLQPDVAVMNMEMPLLDGADATQKITENFADTKVLILTSYDRDEYITKCLAVGAKGYLLKNKGTQDIAAAIRSVAQGYTQIAPGLLDKLLVYTDSGVVLSKLQRSARLQENQNIRQTISSPQRSLSNLQVATRQQQIEIGKLRENINNSQQELPKIKQSLSSHIKYIRLIGLLWLVSLSLMSLFVFRLNNKTNSIRANTIPKERIGLYGEFSLNGIAERVAKVYRKDPILRDISTVYIAQEDDAIILKGTVSDPELLKRMENLAMQVTGVNKVYTSQVAVEPKFRENFLGSEK